MRRIGTATALVAMLAIGCAEEPADPVTSPLVMGQEMVTYDPERSSVIYTTADRKAESVDVWTKCVVVDDRDAGKFETRFVRVRIEGVGVVKVYRHDLRPIPDR